jgi:hypothetical protein
MPIIGAWNTPDGEPDLKLCMAAILCPLLLIVNAPLTR